MKQNMPRNEEHFQTPLQVTPSPGTPVNPSPSDNAAGEPAPAPASVPAPTQAPEASPSVPGTKSFQFQMSSSDSMLLSSKYFKNRTTQILVSIVGIGIVLLEVYIFLRSISNMWTDNSL